MCDSFGPAPIVPSTRLMAVELPILSVGDCFFTPGTLDLFELLASSPAKYIARMSHTSRKQGRKVKKSAQRLAHKVRKELRRRCLLD